MRCGGVKIHQEDAITITERVYASTRGVCSSSNIAPMTHHLVTGNYPSPVQGDVRRGVAQLARHEEVHGSGVV